LVKKQNLQKFKMEKYKCEICLKSNYLDYNNKIKNDMVDINET